MDARGGRPAEWVRAWYAAPARMVGASLSGRTFQQRVELHAGGELVRLQLSNRYGESPVTLTSLAVAPVASMFDASADCAVEFSGQPGVTIPPGEDVVSDPVSLRVEAFSELLVTFFLARGDCTTGHGEARQTSLVSGMGDSTALPKVARFLSFPLKVSSWWFICGIDVAPSQPTRCLVAFGSSTTDGTGSTQDANRRWPDHLARRLQQAGADRFMSVVNAGIGGSQLTAFEPDLSSLGLAALKLPDSLFGEHGLRRVQWDVLAQPGACDLIVHIGSNDLRVGAPASTLIEAFKQLAQVSRQSYRRVFGTTILPGGYTKAQAEQRQTVNDWLRQEGHHWFDAVFEFSQPLEKPNEAHVLDPLVDCGDGIHPNDEGYRLMAEAVDVARLSGSPAGEE